MPHGARQRFPLANFALFQLHFDPKICVRTLPNHLYHPSTLLIAHFCCPECVPIPPKHVTSLNLFIEEPWGPCMVGGPHHPQSAAAQLSLLSLVGLTYLRLCSNRPQANQSRWIPYIHYNRPQTGRRAAFDRSPRARRPLTVKSRPARDLADRDRNLRMRSALLLRVSSLYRFTQPRNRMSITSKFDPHHSPSHHTTSRSRNHFRVMFYDVFGGCEVTKRQSSHLNSHRRPHSAPGRYQAAFDSRHRQLLRARGHQFPPRNYLLHHLISRFYGLFSVF